MPIFICENNSMMFLLIDLISKYGIILGIYNFWIFQWISYFSSWSFLTWSIWLKKACLEFFRNLKQHFFLFVFSLIFPCGFRDSKIFDAETTNVNWRLKFHFSRLCLMRTSQKKVIFFNFIEQLFFRRFSRKFVDNKRFYFNINFL